MECAHACAYVCVCEFMRLYGPWKRERKMKMCVQNCAVALCNELCQQSNVVNRKEKELAILARACVCASLCLSECPNASMCARVFFFIFLLFICCTSFGLCKRVYCCYCCCSLSVASASLYFHCYYYYYDDDGDDDVGYGKTIQYTHIAEVHTKCSM